MADVENGGEIPCIPEESRYIKSEDILYEIKKIQQQQVLPDALYLLDEPEVSLSPMAQVSLAKEINKMARFLGCQFIVATHSPFMLGTLDAKIYNLDTPDYCVCEWNELENVRYFYRFFKDREILFQSV